MIPICEAINDGIYEKIILVCGSQMGKTEAMLNTIGHRLDDDPVPMLYIAPTKSFVEKVFEPRYVAMINQCETLRLQKKPGKREQKTQKEIAGVKFRMAWSGSPTELSGDPACKVFVDERDRMDDSVGGEGDPVTLADARHDTYPDGQTIVTSTPTMGTIDTFIDEETNLEFWGKGDEVPSATWRLFQEGCGYHWACPCPHCADMFIPRFKQLVWGEKLTPQQVKESVQMLCPNCGVLIDQEFKDEMNAGGKFIAPGQWFDDDNQIQGSPPASSTASFWVSGLMSPWKTWGDRAYAFLNAVKTGDADRIQAVINTGMGELYSVKGEAPEIEKVKGLKLGYKSGEVPSDALKLILSVDVQKRGLYYVVRAWGADLESWKVESGYLVGDTDGTTVWKDLAKFKDFHYGALPIERCLIDSGYHTQFVYAFCRKFKQWAFPTKGRDTIESKPLQMGKVDIGTNSGKVLRGGLAVLHVNTDYFKRWIHERIEREPGLPGGFHLPEDVSDDYCKQLVSEARIVKPSGKVVWQRIFKDNHYFDCEVLQVAGAYSLNLQQVTAEQLQAQVNARKVKTQAAVKQRTGKKGDPFRTNRRRPAGRGGGWFSK